MVATESECRRVGYLQWKQSPLELDLNEMKETT